MKNRTDTHSRVDLLDTIPVQSNHVRTEWKDGCAVLAYPRFRHPWMRRWLLPKGMSPDIRVTLEDHGTAVWQLIDGERDVRTIIRLLASHFEGDSSYAFRVTAYLMQLRKDGFIRLLAPVHL